MKLKEYLSVLGWPGLVSSISLLFGWLAIAFLIQNKLKLSVVFVVLAFVFDTFDGYLARATNKVTEIGRQLDSMVDLVVYSVFTGLLAALVLLPGWLGMLVGYMVVIFGVLRLIRFNNDGYYESGPVKYYTGVVVCHLAFAGVVMLLLSTKITIPPTVIAVVLGGLSILQLSNLKTRKTGILGLWYVVSVGLIIGAIAWL